MGGRRLLHNKLGFDNIYASSSQLKFHPVCVIGVTARRGHCLFQRAGNKIINASCTMFLAYIPDGLA